MGIKTPDKVLSEFSSKATFHRPRVKKESEKYISPSDKKASDIICQWVLVDNKTWQAEGATSSTLVPGFYEVSRNSYNSKPMFTEMTMNVDNLVRFTDCIANDVLAEIEDFWSKEEEFKKFGFVHYRGYLLYGAHGSGKTSLVQLIAKGIIDKGGIVLVCKNPAYFIDGIKDLRQIEPDRQIVGVFEDIEAMVETYGESEILAYLDGEYKVDKVLNIATTNYPELLDKRIVGRPRRFDRVIKVEYPNSEERKTYFETKIDKKEAQKWAEKTEGLSFAALAEMVISVKCLGKPFDEALTIMKTIQESSPSSDDGRPTVGFSSKREEPEEDD